ncbi:MAG: Rrf2 family transcriptional regulator [Lactovum sp.]
MRNNKLSVAVHIICLIEKLSASGHVVISDFIAGSVNINPASVRRIIPVLTKSEIIYKSNGYQISHFKKLTLYDVLKSVDYDNHLFYPHTNSNLQCPVGSEIEGKMLKIYSGLEKNLDNELKEIKLSEIIQSFK